MVVSVDLLNTLSAHATFISGAGNHFPPQYLAAQLTIIQPERADYPHLLLLAPPNLFHLPTPLQGICWKPGKTSKF